MRVEGIVEVNCQLSLLHLRLFCLIPLIPTPLFNVTTVFPLLYRVILQKLKLLYLSKKKKIKKYTQFTDVKLLMAQSYHCV